LKCDEHISKGLFASCKHWELSTGESLELRFAPSYSQQPFALILWESPGNTQQPGVRVGTSVEADSAFEALKALSVSLLDQLTGIGENAEPCARIAATLGELDRLSESVEAEQARHNSKGA